MTHELCEKKEGYFMGREEARPLILLLPRPLVYEAVRIVNV